MHRTVCRLVKHNTIHGQNNRARFQLQQLCDGSGAKGVRISRFRFSAGAASPGRKRDDHREGIPIRALRPDLSPVGGHDALSDGES